MAQIIAGKASRDSLYLEHLGSAYVPVAVLATSALAVVLMLGSGRLLRSVTPERAVPAGMAAAALLLLLEWALFAVEPRAAAVALYLQISALAPMLASGMWLIASERYDPHAAKHAFGQMVAAGALGGLAGSAIGERVAAVGDATLTLPVLAALNLAGAWQVHRLGAYAAGRTDPPPELAPARTASSLGTLARIPYLRHLAALVLLSAVTSTLLDYALKVQADGFFRGESLLQFQFFSLYYAVTSVLMLVVQLAAHRAALETFGLAGTVATSALAAVAGGVGAIVVPGLVSASVARGGESVFRGSLFRSAYEIFYTPVSPADKRAAKSIIDVGFERLGDAIGAALALLVLAAAAGWQHTVVVSLAIAASLCTLVVARRLTQGYVLALEQSLRDRAAPLPEVQDRTTRSVVWQSIGRHVPPGEPVGRSALSKVFDADMLQIMAIRSGDPARIARVLDARNPLGAALVAHVIPLLDRTAVADGAMRALTAAAKEHSGAIVDALLDPSRPMPVRRRLARVLAANPSPRAVEGLLRGLDDDRFEVRAQCGLSLAQIRQGATELPFDQTRIFGAVLSEVARGRTLWESHQSLERLDDPGGESFVDEYVRERTHRGLAHVFTLLSIALPPEPLRIAFRALHTDDTALRGTALEYLESVLPSDLREALWPFLDDSRARTGPAQQRHEIVARLVHSHPTILLNLQRLARNSEDTPSQPRRRIVPEPYR